MHTKYCFLYLIVFGIFSKYTFGQATAISIGDKCPDIAMRNILNSSSDMLRISDFSGKILILDFWSTWCGPCVNELQRLDSIQKQFKDKIQVLPVTYEKRRDVERFFKSMESIKHLSRLSSVTEDTILSNIFPHLTIPYFVWIDAAGIFRAQTGPNELNLAEIDKFIKNVTDLSAVKKEAIKKIDYNKQLFSLTNRVLDDYGKSHLEEMPPKTELFYSALTKHIDGLRAGGHINDTVISFIDCTVFQLYSLALTDFDISQIHSLYGVDMKDSLLYRTITGDNVSGAE